MVNDLFCTTAQEDGVVTSLTDEAILITYKSGKTKAVEIGRRFGSASGMTIPHTLVTPMKAGQSFKAGQTIAFNKDFFEEDFFNPGFLVYKGSLMANVALYESPLTDEDASLISYRLAKRLQTKMSKVKPVTIDFTQEVTMMVKEGDTVSSTDILCLIDDVSTAGKEYFSRDSLDMLRTVNKFTPTAGIDGVIERIEVRYHGETEDMSESLRVITNASDRRLAKLRKGLGKTVVTGEVDEGFRIDGSPLDFESCVIKFYITTDVSAGVADKIVVSGQLKSVISKVMDDDVVSEFGVPVDVAYGRKSVQARIVTSADLVGTSTLCLRLIGKMTVKAYGS